MYMESLWQLWLHKYYGPSSMATEWVQDHHMCFSYVGRVENAILFPTGEHFWCRSYTIPEVFLFHFFKVTDSFQHLFCFLWPLDERPHPCKTCSKAFKNKWALAQHQLTHSGMMQAQPASNYSQQTRPWFYILLLIRRCACALGARTSLLVATF